MITDRKVSPRRHMAHRLTFLSLRSFSSSSLFLTTFLSPRNKLKRAEIPRSKAEIHPKDGADRVFRKKKESIPEVSARRVTLRAAKLWKGEEEVSPLGVSAGCCGMPSPPPLPHHRGPGSRTLFISSEHFGEDLFYDKHCFKSRVCCCFTFQSEILICMSVAIADVIMVCPLFPNEVSGQLDHEVQVI